MRSGLARPSSSATVYLTEPTVLTQQWDHRPDLDFSRPAEACDRAVAERYLEYRVD